MSTRPRFRAEYIRDELGRIATRLQTDVEAYLIGGGAMSLRGLKDTTKDIDLVVTTEAEYEHLLGALDVMGYKELTDLGEAYRQLGARHCVQNEDGCQLDLFNRQIANKLVFSHGMEERSETFLQETPLRVGLVSLEDIFLFKCVGMRPDDVDDMATLVQTGLEFETIIAEIEAQVSLLGGELFTTYISESLDTLDERHGIQTPLDDVIPEYYERYMNGYELRRELDEDDPQTTSELANALDLDGEEVESRIDYLERHGFAERTSAGIYDTGKTDRFQGA